MFTPQGYAALCFILFRCRGVDVLYQLKHFGHEDGDDNGISRSERSSFTEVFFF